MILLGIETSCDETSVAIIESSSENTLTIKSHVTATSLDLHAKTGGIIPEVAAREQVKFMLPVLQEALLKGLNFSFTSKEIPPIDAIAVTYGPGLIGSLLVGIETARTLSFLWNKPLIPVNHMVGHLYANWIVDSINNPAISHTPYAKTPTFPAIGLVVSGGHTDILFIKDHGDITLLGGTRDDAAGEAFDKVGRLLGLAYPAGPEIERRARIGNAKMFPFPRPMIGSPDYDFSFSGLKTAVYRETKNHPILTEDIINDICASTLEAIVAVLVRKTMKAVKEYEVSSLIVSGGVAANQKLRDKFAFEIGNLRPFSEGSPLVGKFDIGLFVPPARLCTDNGAMIAAAGFFNQKHISWTDLKANPELYFDK